MLPQGRWFFLPVIAGAWLCAGAMLGGCQQRGTPEAQVRAVIAAGEHLGGHRLDHNLHAFRLHRLGRCAPARRGVRRVRA